MSYTHTKTALKRHLNGRIGYLAGIRYVYILPFYLLSTLIACDAEAEKRQLIEQEINNSVTSHREKKLRECRVAALDSANKIVDSIILARNTQIDTSLFTGKPVKPTKPIIKSPLDTTPVVPILPK
jgi:hypothetical protein